jgi:hypothetical protein
MADEIKLPERELKVDAYPSARTAHTSRLASSIRFISGEVAGPSSERSPNA